MKIIHYTDIEAKVFSGDAVKGVAGRVFIGQADGARNFCMRAFELAAGGYTLRHKHEWEHEIFVYQGEGSLFRDGEWIPISSGNVVFIPPNEEHQMKNVGETPFTFVCLIPSGAPEL